MITRTLKGKLARNLLGLYESAVGFATPREESVRTRFTSFHLRRYQKDLITFLRSYIRKPCAFFDVGANIGYVSSEASRLVGRGGMVVAFEPNPTVYALLAKNCRNFSNISTCNVAVGDRETTLSLNFCQDETAQASLLASSRQAGMLSVEVPVVTLSGHLEKVSALAQIVLKIDVEGFELPVLRGLGNGRVPDCIVAEYNPKWQRVGGFDPREFYDWFVCAGYSINILGAGGTVSQLTWETFTATLEQTPSHPVPAPRL